jgi:hypothetical protein
MGLDNIAVTHCKLNVQKQSIQSGHPELDNGVG